MRQATPAVDLGAIDETLSLLKDYVDQLDDRKVESAFSRLLDHMSTLREALLDLEDLLRNSTRDSDACQFGT